MSQVDTEMQALLKAELVRQQNHLVLIASENYTSAAVMAAQGSVATNKYAEGYPGKRYYAGCECVDKMESLAIERAKKMFGVEYVNVQPHSGSQANAAVFLALLKPSDVILGLDLQDGGHLTHGSRVNMSGKYYRSVAYGLDPASESLDYDAIEAIAVEHKPKLIIAGYSAYALSIDWKRFRDIADRVGAYLLADICHVSGLIVAGVYPSPVGYADVITTTTHKSLRGPRGGMIMVPRDADLAKKIDSAIFPGLQGGPMMHAIAGKAVSFYEALQPEFIQYQKQVLTNARCMAQCFKDAGFHVVSGSTDSHLFLINLTSTNLTGKQAEKCLADIGIIVNKNTVPGEKRSPFVTSGFRVGTLGITTRGFDESSCKVLSEIMIRCLQYPDDAETVSSLRNAVQELCDKFPIYEQLD